ncbi:MAG: NAD-dependent epimerase/dehydratase family protein, partial [Gammaproteobacteria bacterium]|nr:NAD-dependent epimerase/dehydratase family protein [Gammaproteobacteria bacterium]
MNDQTICILGGSGFVGHHITNRLMSAGYRIRILTRRREQHRDLLVMPAVEMHEANIHDVNELKEYTTGCSAIINLVGLLNQSGTIGESFNEAHIKLPASIAKVCQQNNISRVLHMSALNADVARGHSYYL